MEARITILFILITTIHVFSSSPPPVQWEKTYGDSARKYKVHSMEKTSDNCLLVVGKEKNKEKVPNYNEPRTVSYSFAMKIKGNGDSLWLVRHKERQAEGFNYGSYSVEEVSDGYVFAGNMDGYVGKINKSGNIEWVKEIYPSSERGLAVFGLGFRKMGDNRFIHVIRTMGKEFGVVLLDQNYENVWEGVFEDTRSEAYTVRRLNDSELLLAGFQGNYPHLWIFNIDSTKCTWDMQYDKKDHKVWYFTTKAACRTPDGGFAFLISKNSPFPAKPIYLIKYNADRTFQWEEAIDGCTFGNSIEVMPDGGYIIGTNKAIIRTDKQGNVLWRDNAPTYCEGKYVQPADDGGCYFSYGTDPLLWRSKTPTKFVIRKYAPDGISANDDLTNKHISYVQPMSIRQNGNQLHFSSNLENNTCVEIYSVQGRMISSTMLTQGQLHVTIPERASAGTIIVVVKSNGVVLTKQAVPLF